MKKILKYFLDNLKITVSLISIVLGVALLVFLLLTSLEYVTAMFATPVVTFIVSALFVVVFISVLLTLSDIFLNRGN